MRECQRCGNTLSWTHDVTKLFGGVVAHLCVECRTEWHERFMQSDLWTDSKAYEVTRDEMAARAAAQRPPSVLEFQQLKDEECRLQEVGFQFGKAFVAERITREVQRSEEPV